MNYYELINFIILYKGEQHGFRKSENIQKALDGEFYFFSKVFGFEAADNDLKVTNIYIFYILSGVCNIMVLVYNTIERKFS